MPQTIEILINGTRKEVPEGLNIEQLLASLNVPGDRVAIELNRAIVGKRAWGSTPVEAGAQLEIVQFVGGG